MLIHRTEKDGNPVSVTLEQEATELRPQWAEAAGKFIEENFPNLTFSQLLQCSVNTAGSRAATLIINLETIRNTEFNINA
jgi:hypothetical protein